MLQDVSLTKKMMNNAQIQMANLVMAMVILCKLYPATDQAKCYCLQILETELWLKLTLF